MSAITSTRLAKPAAVRVSEPIAPDDRFEPVNWPYRIISVNNRMLGEFGTLHEALDAYNGWAQAAAITLGAYIVHQRKAGGR